MNMIMYLTYDWEKASVRIRKDDALDYYHCNSIKEYLNRRCQQEGSTLQGRREAFSQLVNARKHIPVLTSVRRGEIFMPFGKMDDPQTIWINLRAVQYYSAEGNGTRIFFINGESLLLDFRQPIVKRQIERSQLYITLIGE